MSARRRERGTPGGVVGSGAVDDERVCGHTPYQRYTRAPCSCGRELWPPRGRGRGESLLSPRRVAAKLQALDALALAASGYTYRTIARTLGYRTTSGAWQAVQRLRDQEADWARWEDRTGRGSADAGGPGGGAGSRWTGWAAVGVRTGAVASVPGAACHGPASWRPRACRRAVTRTYRGTFWGTVWSNALCRDPRHAVWQGGMMVCGEVCGGTINTSFRQTPLVARAGGAPDHPPFPHVCARATR